MTVASQGVRVGPKSRASTPSIQMKKAAPVEAGDCCHAVMIAYADWDSGNMGIHWRSASEGLVPPDLVAVGG